MNRADIFKLFNSEDYNPYDIDRFVLLLNNKSKKAFDVYIKNYIKEFISCAGDDRVKNFIKRIPHQPIYKDEDIEKSNVLILSNEPGWSSKAENIYRDIEGIDEENWKKTVSTCFKESMFSWISMTEHKHGGVNGCAAPKSTIDKSFGFKDYGYVAYFLSTGDEFIDQSEIQAMHLDFMPFSQVDSTDVNELNDRDHLEGRIKNIFKKVKLISDEKSLINKFDICSSGDIDVKLLLECLFIYNCYMIRKFVTTGENKYLLVVGNRCLRDGEIISRDYYKSCNNSFVFYSILQNLIVDYKVKINIRIIDEWPKKLKSYFVRKPIISNNKDNIFCY